MKLLTIIDNQWKERAQIELTEAEKTLLRLRSPEARALIERLKSESHKEPSAEDAAAAQALYDQHKIEGADLISADISLPEGTGIINCRVDGEHKQIRF